LFGDFAPDVQNSLVGHVHPGGAVVDIGANAGFFTLLASRLVGPKGRVFAFEPSREALGFLYRHLELNRAANVTVVEAAVSDRTGMGLFLEGRDHSTGRLASTGTFEVRTTTLDDVAAASGFEPSVLKIDVEGGERAVLAGAAEVLARARPTVVLAVHGLERLEQCSALLSEHGYRLQVLHESGERDQRYRAEVLAVPPPTARTP
jgi:FkbM family methyltransferase